MKIEVTDKNEKPFPKLMVCNSNEQTIILATGLNIRINTIVGVVISTNHVRNRVGEYSDSWSREYYKDFEGSITLSND